MIAKYSIEWVKGVVLDLASIIHIDAESISEKIDRTVIYTNSDSRLYKTFIHPNLPYVIACTTESAIKRRTLENKYVKMRGYKHGLGLIDENMPWFTDDRMLNLFLDTYPGTILATGNPEENHNFCKIFNRLLQTWTDNQNGKTIEWDKIVDHITENIVRNIHTVEIGNITKVQGEPSKFLLRPHEEGFVFENDFYSTSQTKGYKLEPIPYLVVKHLYDNLGDSVHGSHLRDLVQSSKPRFKNGKPQKVSEALSKYFSESRQPSIRNLLNELVVSTGKTGAYRLNI